MTELTVRVLKQLKTIFPHFDEGLLLTIINNPDHRTGILTVDTLVVRCVEQILEGEEAAEKRLKNAEVDKTAMKKKRKSKRKSASKRKGKKKPETCASESTGTGYSEEDQTSNDGASVACCSDISITESHLDVSQSPKSSSSFGISSLTLDIRDEKRDGPKLVPGEGQSGAMMKDWLAKHAKCGPKTDAEDRVSDSAADGCAQTAAAASEDDSSLDGRLTPTASSVRENSSSPGPSSDACSTSDFEIISLRSGVDTSLDCWSEESQSEGCKTPCNDQPEDSIQKESEDEKDIGESDTDIVTVKTSQDNVDYLSSDTLDSQPRSSHQNMDSSSSSEDHSVISVPDGGCVLSDRDVSAEDLTEKRDNIVIDISDIEDTPVKSENNVINISDIADTPVKRENSVIDISDIVELESPVRQPKLTDSLFGSVCTEPGMSVDPLDLNNAEDDTDTDSVIPSQGKTDLKVETIQTDSTQNYASTSNQLCNRAKQSGSHLLSDSNSKVTSKSSTFVGKEDMDSGTSGGQPANPSQNHVEQRVLHSSDCVVTSSDSDVPKEQFPSILIKDYSDITPEDAAPIQSFQISSNSADKESYTQDPVSHPASLSQEINANTSSQTSNSERSRVLGVKKVKKTKKHVRFLELVKKLNQSCGAASVLLKETSQVKPEARETCQSSSRSQNVSNLGITLTDGKTGTKGQNPESESNCKGSPLSQQTTEPMTAPNFDLSLPYIPLPMRRESKADRVKRIRDHYVNKTLIDMKRATCVRQGVRSDIVSQPQLEFKSAKHKEQVLDSNNASKLVDFKSAKHQAQASDSNNAKRMESAADRMRKNIYERAAEKTLIKFQRERHQAQVAASAVAIDLENRTRRAELALSLAAMKARHTLQTPLMTAMSTDSTRTTDRLTVQAPSTMVTGKVPIVMTVKQGTKKTPTPGQSNSISYSVSGDIQPGHDPVLRPDQPQSLVLGSMEDLEPDMQQVTAIFPDVDVNWARTELRSMKARYPDAFLDHMCSMMADSGYMKTEESSSSNAGESSTGGGKHRSVNVKGTLGKIKSAQRYVDVLSEIGEEAETLKRLGRKRPLEEAMDVTDVVPSKISVMTERTDSLPNVPDVANTEPGENTSSDSVFRLPCESCEMLASTTNLTQCCEGHLLCKACVEKCVKHVLAQEAKTTIICSVKQCSSEIRLVDAKKVLPQFVVDLLQDRIDKQERSSINRMSNMVSCPDCGVSVMMETLDKQFHCPNTDCMLASCRYCKREWNDGRHNYCNPFLSVPSREECTHYPKHWDPIAPDFAQDYMKVVVPHDSMEFIHINEQFKRSMHHFKIIRLTRIQNPKLWQKYGLTRSHILEDFGPGKLNENHLFHGTDPNVVEAICREGFDWRLCGQHGVAFGHGSYFAVDADYSHKYTVAVRSHFPAHFPAHAAFIQQQAAMGIQVLLLARVVCGRYTLGTGHLRRPPPDHNDVKKRPFNSVVNNIRRPTIYVTFDSCQTYPEYVIEYDKENFVGR